MPKGGSGFRRDARNAARQFGRGSAWSFGNAREAAERVADFYARTYRNNDVQFTYDRNGRLTDMVVSDRFFEGVDALSRQLAEGAVVVDKEAARTASQLRQAARSMRLNAGDAREVSDRTGIRFRTGRRGNADTAADERSSMGTFITDRTHQADIASDLQNRIRAAESSIRVPVSKALGPGGVSSTQASIAESLRNRYQGVYERAQRRRR